MGQISNRDDLELMFGKRVLELTREQRGRLIVLLGSPPNPLNVPQSFWMELGRSMYDRIILILALIASRSAEEHGATAFHASLIARQWAEPHARTMVANWIDHSIELLQTAHELQHGQESPPTKSDATEVVDRILGPDRIGRMASTETTSAQTAGAENAVVAAGGISPRDLWFTRDDGKVCPVCRPLHETPRSFWSQYVPSGPPAHPDCRCYLLYENLNEIRQELLTK